MERRVGSYYKISQDALFGCEDPTFNLALIEATTNTEANWVATARLRGKQALKPTVISGRPIIRLDFSPQLAFIFSYSRFIDKITLKACGTHMIFLLQYIHMFIQTIISVIFSLVITLLIISTS
jgi:hypothetical protein